MPTPKRNRFNQGQRRKRQADARKIKARAKRVVVSEYQKRELERERLFVKIQSSQRDLLEFGKLVLAEKRAILRRETAAGKKVTDNDATILAAGLVLDQILAGRHRSSFVGLFD